MLLEKCFREILKMFCSDVFFFLVLTVGRGVAELWSRLLLFQLFQLVRQLSNLS